MNTVHTSTGRSEPQHQASLPHETPAPLPSGAKCRFAAQGVCLVSEYCQHKDPDTGKPFSAHPFPRRSVRRGDSLYRAGDALVNLYQLYAGSMKMRVTTVSGAEHIVSFPMSGALLGLDGIETGAYTCDAIALEDSLVCILSFSGLLSGSCDNQMAAQRLIRAIARGANDYRHLLSILAGTKSEERVAGFLVDISEKMAANGYSPGEFVLKMTREDIAHHLGMKLETVSRVFTRLQVAHVLEVSRRHLNILDPVALKKIGADH